MKKGQGSLEYLIITAAVLAIAAVVVLFLTGALGGAGGQAAICKVEASNCAAKNATTIGYDCKTPCRTACADTAGKDVLSGVVVTDASCTWGAVSPAVGCQRCSSGNSTGL